LRGSQTICKLWLAPAVWLPYRGASRGFPALVGIRVFAVIHQEKGNPEPMSRGSLVYEKGKGA